MRYLAAILLVAALAFPACKSKGRTSDTNYSLLLMQKQIDELKARIDTCQCPK